MRGTKGGLSSAGHGPTLFCLMVLGMHCVRMHAYLARLSTTHPHHVIASARYTANNNLLAEWGNKMEHFWNTGTVWNAFSITPHHEEIASKCIGKVFRTIPLFYKSLFPCILTVPQTVPQVFQSVPQVFHFVPSPSQSPARRRDPSCLRVGAVQAAPALSVAKGAWTGGAHPEATL